MKLNERITILVQAATLSQKSGALTFDDAVKAKTAIDLISLGEINQKFTSAINMLIEIAISSQKKGVFSIKDSHMLYLAIEGIEVEIKNEVNNLNCEKNINDSESDSFNDNESQNKNESESFNDNESQNKNEYQNLNKYKKQKKNKYKKHKSNTNINNEPEIFTTTIPPIEFGGN